MKVIKILKWIGIGVGVLIGIIVLAGAYLYIRGGEIVDRVRTIPVDHVVVPTGDEAIARGKEIAQSRLCTECHKEDLRGGQVFLDDPNIGTFASANLTPGKGGVGSTYTDQDWVNALRYGVNPQGRTLIIMPSELYHYLDDDDMGNLVAYLKTLPPVDNTPPARRVGPMGRLIVAMGQFETAADQVAALPARPAAVPAGPTAEYGKYLASTSCTHCHGENMAGMVWPQGDPSAKLTPNLTPGGELLVWSQEDFIKAMRTGEAPGGKKLDSERMPWKSFAHHTDGELAAIYAYLKSLPKTESPKAE